MFHEHMILMKLLARKDELWKCDYYCHSHYLTWKVKCSRLMRPMQMWIRPTNSAILQLCMGSWCCTIDTLERRSISFALWNLAGELIDDMRAKLDDSICMGLQCYLMIRIGSCYIIIAVLTFVNSLSVASRYIDSGSR